MLKTFLDWVGEATFVERLALNESDAVAFCFQREDRPRFWIAYTPGEACDVAFPEQVEGVWDAFGNPMATAPGGATVRLSGRPVYLKSSLIG